MFVDMAVLVEEQSEVIDRIAFQVQNVKKDVRVATEELREANRIQRQKCSIQWESFVLLLTPWTLIQ